MILVVRSLLFKLLRDAPFNLMIGELVKALQIMEAASRANQACILLHHKAKKNECVAENCESRPCWTCVWCSWQGANQCVYDDAAEGESPPLAGQEFTLKDSRKV